MENWALKKMGPRWGPEFVGGTEMAPGGRLNDLENSLRKSAGRLKFFWREGEESRMVLSSFGYWILYGCSLYLNFSKCWSEGEILLETKIYFISGIGGSEDDLQYLALLGAAPSPKCGTLT